MRYLALLGTLLLASGCWGGEFNSVQEKAEPVTTTDAPGVTSTTDGAGATSDSGSGGSDSTTDSSSTTTTTGASGSGAEGSVDSTTSTTGEPEACRPPTEIPELSELVLGEYEQDWNGMCYSVDMVSGAVSREPGSVSCAEEPCLSVDLDVTLISVSEDGLMFDVIVPPQEPMPVPMVHHCEHFGQVSCPWEAKVSDDGSNLSESIYTLELIETPTGYAVGDFYVKGLPHNDSSNQGPLWPEGNFVGHPDCSQSTWGFSDLLKEAWLQHLDKIHSLAWECAS